MSLNTKKLDALIKAFKGNVPVAQVGILANKNQRISGASNASIGAAHEYGTENLPVRSFLRLPITENLEKYLAKSGAFSKDVLAKVIASGSAVEWVRLIGFTAERIVADAFASRGFGKWAPWKNPNYKNNSNMLLVDTTQLKGSISSRVKE